ncbi:MULTISPECIES: DUF3500 domain-containing protein [unclassified Streptomyces]|uniref:DUF3500 domain-containing protein n=1 Tax=unclassified Streptomyces TaxID=2593676 RepID=UPI002E2C2522|nr:DUF3500 domain-containing protein [Streptomyces sp. NBC_01423]WSX94755.1 DUF3500 domain-containing protein [Streptomyces sp. NBC_00891]WSY09235.1 DUF3500 domain-containing protein [Streptomyces sp. NBC_00890]WSZ10857.1 DUF3500 domain-containing protein [Streptomyces sp. NBC_00869]WSZ21639.1 DUF3500 domain-containing protein [Streptomyces sp. NBC_00870]
MVEHTGGADLTGEQLDAVRDLLFYYVETGPDELSRQYREQVLAAAPRDIRFAWAGGREANTSHYYRISTRDLLVEADNAVAAGQHVHAVWRDLNNDLGQEPRKTPSARRAFTRRDRVGPSSPGRGGVSR